MNRLGAARTDLARLISTPVILIGIVLLMTLITIVRDDVVFERVVIVMFVNMVLVVGLQAFMGNSGLGSFGQYAFVTIGAYSSIWFSLTPAQKRVALPDMPEEWWLYGQHLPFTAAVIIGGVVAAAVGAVIGIAFVRLRGASFTIATFAFLIVVNRVALQWEEITRGSRTVIGIPRYTTLWVVVAWVIVAIVVAYAFKESPLGLKLRASREDEDAAASVGVAIERTRWIAWVLSVFLAGIGGALWAHFIQQFSPHNFYLRETFLIIAMLVIGGSGSVSGAVIGALAVALSSEMLRQFENWVNLQRQTGTEIGELIPFQLVGFTEIVIALAMIAVLILRPSGLLAGRELAWPRRRAVSRVRQEDPFA
jgi:branched-chain amino acid transport system permease protein